MAGQRRTWNLSSSALVAVVLWVTASWQASSHEEMAGSACEAASPHCSGDPDETGLLQQNIAQFSLSASVSTSARRASASAAATSGGVTWSLSGGGFRAHAMESGVLAGLLAFNKKRLSVDPLDTLSRVDTFVGISGGSWFGVMLTFSPHFMNLIDEMAENPNGASEAYYNGFIHPMIAAMGHSGGIPLTWAKYLPSQVRYYYEILAELLFLGVRGNDYVSLVNTILEAGGVPSNLTFGSGSFNPWAKGKLMIVGTALFTVGGEGPGTCAQSDSPGMCMGRETGGKMRIWSGQNGPAVDMTTVGDTPKTLPSYVPTRFAIKVGAGPESSAALPFCVSQSACDNVSTYIYSSAQNQAASPLVNYSAYTETAGRLPIASISSASSAFLGGFIAYASDYWTRGLALNLTDFIYSQIHGFFDIPTSETNETIKEGIKSLLETDLAVWGSNAQNGQAFAKGRELHDRIRDNPQASSQKDLDDIARQMLHPIVDGGFVDNTGVLNAVAAGATEVVVFLNDFVENDFTQMFQNSSKTANFFDFYDDDCPFCLIYFKIFAQDHKDVKRQMEETFWDLDTPTGKTKFTIGTVNATTVDNLYWNVEAGRSVTLRVVSALQTTLGMGGTDYTLFGALAQELAEALQLDAGVNRAAALALSGWLGMA